MSLKSNRRKAVMDKDAYVANFESGDWTQVDYHHTEGPLKGVTLASAIQPDRCPPLAELKEGRRVVLTYKDEYSGPGSQLDKMELDDSLETLTPEERLVYLAYLLGELYQHMEDEHGAEKAPVGHSLLNLYPKIAKGWTKTEGTDLGKAFGIPPSSDEITEVERILRKVKAWE